LVAVTLIVTVFLSSVERRFSVPACKLMVDFCCRVRQTSFGYFQRGDYLPGFLQSLGFAQYIRGPFDAMR
jgi:hypothetical protein